MREEPADGDTNVLLVCAQALGPSACPSAGQSAFATNAPKCSACRFSTSARSSLAARRSCELPYRGQHVEPRLGVNGIDRDEAVPCERVEQVEVRSSVRSATSTAASSVHPSTNTDKVASMPLLGVVQQPEAPFHGRPQCSLPFWEVDRSAAQCIEASFQPSEQSSRLQHPVRAAASSMARGDRRRAGRSPRWQRRCRRSGRSCGGPP